MNVNIILEVRNIFFGFMAAVQIQAIKKQKEQHTYSYISTPLLNKGWKYGFERTHIGLGCAWREGGGGKGLISWTTFITMRQDDRTNYCSYN